MRTCHCTNQCPACGQCCAVPCAHRGSATGGWTTTTGNITITPQPLTPDDVRRIIREELDRQERRRDA